MLSERYFSLALVVAIDGILRVSAKEIAHYTLFFITPFSLIHSHTLLSFSFLPSPPPPKHIRSLAVGLDMRSSSLIRLAAAAAFVVGTNAQDASGTEDSSPTATSSAAATHTVSVGAV